MSGTGICVLVALIALIAVIYAIARTNDQKAQTINRAHATYQQALADLRANPGSTQIREGVLAYGRQYANIARQNGQRTIFDEMALANDLASIPVPVSVATATAAPATNAEERLRQLTRLRDQALISADEYEKRRQQIINEV